MSRLRLTPPIFLLEATTHCWKCGVEAKAVSLACMKAAEQENPASGFEEISEEGEPITLSDVTELPESILKQIQHVHAHFALRHSHTAGRSYFVNFCPACDALFGDFFLHCEPGGAFFPMSDKEAAAISIRKLDCQEALVLSASAGMGTEREIFRHARRL